MKLLKKKLFALLLSIKHSEQLQLLTVMSKIYLTQPKQNQTLCFVIHVRIF